MPFSKAIDGVVLNNNGDVGVAAQGMDEMVSADAISISIPGHNDNR